MLRRGMVLFFSLLLLLSFTGCGRSSQSTETQTSQKRDIPPKSAISGYYASSQSIQGGQDSDDVNLKDIQMKKDGEDTVITLSFVYGSETMGMDETAVDSVPFYSIKFLKSPNRFVLYLEGLNYWDYTTDENWSKENPLYLGVFRQEPMDDNTTTLYFNVSSDIAYKVEEKKDQLILHLHPVEDKTAAEKAYYVTVNAFNEYQDSAFPEDTGLYPSLCRDFVNTTLISSPFTNSKDAEKQKEKIEKKLKGPFPGKVAKVVELSKGQLPVYDGAADIEGIEKKPMVREGSSVLSLPLMIPDGRFLTWAPDDSFYVYTKPVPDKGEKDDQGIPVITEEVWQGDKQDNRHRLMEYQFASILEASFSPDGSKLVLMEQLEEMRVLYLYDLATKEIVNLGEEGFGTNTSNFVWAANSKALYAMTGEESPQLMEYDLTKPVGDRVSAVEEQPGSDGDMAFYNGKIVFADENTGKVGKIYSIDPADKIRRTFAEGSSFKVSPDGKWMAIVEITAEEEENMQTTLKIRNIDTGDEKVISQKDLVMDYNWDCDSKKLYYALDKGNSDKDAFATGLWSYDAAAGQSKALVDMATSEFYPSNVPGQVLLVDIYTSKGDYLPVTYRLDLNKLK